MMVVIFVINVEWEVVRVLVGPVVMSAVYSWAAGIEMSYLHLFDSGFELTGHFSSSLPVLCRL